MNIKKAALFVLVLVMISVSCNLFTPGSPDNGVDLSSIGQSAADLPVLDPDAPLPSPGAALLQILAADEPGVSALIGDVEAAEQAALKVAVEDMKTQLGADSNGPDPASLALSPFGMSSAALPGSSVKGALAPVVYRLPAVPSAEGGGLSAASIVGLLSGMFSDLFVSQMPVMPTRDFSQTTKSGNATDKMSLKVGRGEDGATHFGMGLQTEDTKDGVSAKTDINVDVDGWRCPNADGQVSFTIKARIGSESGGTGTTQDLTAFVRATVGDDAEITSSTFDVTEGTLQSKGGRQVYVESGVTWKFGPEYTNGKTSNLRLIQNTDNATRDDISALTAAGHEAAVQLGISSLASAQLAWQDGKCVKIEADSPGKVDPGSTTAIPVNVISISDGVVVSSKLAAALTGGASIDPTSLAKTPGTLTYTAPNEAGKSATILLTATSKRGKAKLELTANTGELKKSYQVIETPGINRSWTGACIDDLSQPFSLGFTAPEQTVSFSFSPVSSTSGSLIETIHFALGGTTMDYTGTGNYEIIPDNKDAEGNVIGMEIAYTSAGSAKSCAGGKCVTNQMDMGKGVQIPLRVQDGACSDQ